MKNFFKKIGDKTGIRYNKNWTNEELLKPEALLLTFMIMSWVTICSRNK